MFVGSESVDWIVEATQIKQYLGDYKERRVDHLEL